MSIQEKKEELHKLEVAAHKLRSELEQLQVIESQKSNEEAITMAMDFINEVAKKLIPHGYRLEPAKVIPRKAEPGTWVVGHVEAMLFHDGLSEDYYSVKLCVLYGNNFGTPRNIRQAELKPVGRVYMGGSVDEAMEEIRPYLVEAAFLRETLREFDIEGRSLICKRLLEVL